MTMKVAANVVVRMALILKRANKNWRTANVCSLN